MATAQLVDTSGKKTGEVTLSDAVFAAQLNKDLLHNALVRQLANARAGSANTKTRAEVAGGGRKPWKQKGTGRARAGSIRSPLWEGGGVIFGPKPRDHSLKMPKKMRQHALACALSAKTSSLIVVDDLAGLKQGKTKEVATMLGKLGLTGSKILLVLDSVQSENSKVALAARNIANLKVVQEGNLNVKDLLDCTSIVITRAAVETVDKRLSATGKDTQQAEQKAQTKTSTKRRAAALTTLQGVTAKGKPDHSKGAESSASDSRAKAVRPRKKTEEADG